MSRHNPQKLERCIQERIEDEKVNVVINNKKIIVIVSILNKIIFKIFHLMVLLIFILQFYDESKMDEIEECVNSWRFGIMNKVETVVEKGSSTGK